MAAGADPNEKLGGAVLPKENGAGSVLELGAPFPNRNSACLESDFVLPNRNAGFATVRVLEPNRKAGLASEDAVPDKNPDLDSVASEVKPDRNTGLTSADRAGSFDSAEKAASEE